MLPHIQTTSHTASRSPWDVPQTRLNSHFRETMSNSEFDGRREKSL